VAQAAELARQKNPDLDEATIAQVANAVGIGAIKYADLSNDRIKDYVFDWQRMLALDGNTAPYPQYAYARVRSIFSRAGIDAIGAGHREHVPIAITAPAEHALAIELLGFADVIATVDDTMEFHRLAGYLHVSSPKSRG
jgi:arginyl-tRNA synthetase